MGVYSLNLSWTNLFCFCFFVCFVCFCLNGNRRVDTFCSHVGRNLKKIFLFHSSSWVGFEGVRKTGVLERNFFLNPEEVSQPTWLTRKWVLNTTSHFKAHISHTDLLGPLRPVLKLSVAGPPISFLICTKAQMKRLIEHSGNQQHQPKHIKPHLVGTNLSLTWIALDTIKRFDDLPSHYLIDYLTSWTSVCMGWKVY